jgi:hypothetical protein
VRKKTTIKIYIILLGSWWKCRWMKIALRYILKKLYPVIITNNDGVIWGYELIIWIFNRADFRALPMTSTCSFPINCNRYEAPASDFLTERLKSEDYSIWTGWNLLSAVSMLIRTISESFNAWRWNHYKTKIANEYFV